MNETLNDDRRIALRQPCQVEILTIEHEELGKHACVVMDISRKGFRLRMPLCIPCGSEITVHPPDGTDLRPGRARIMRQQVVDQGGKCWFECGIQFTDSAD